MPSLERSKSTSSGCSRIQVESFPYLLFISNSIDDLCHFLTFGRDGVHDLVKKPAQTKCYQFFSPRMLSCTNLHDR